MENYVCQILWSLKFSKRKDEGKIINNFGQSASLIFSVEKVIQAADKNVWEFPT